MWWWIGGGALGVVVVVVALVALLDVLRRRDELTRAQVSAYVILIVLVPVVGSVLYGLFGRRATA